MFLLSIVGAVIAVGSIYPRSNQNDARRITKLKDC